ncbi:probable G-protein coupled receptor 158 [Eupeodes corollae]|uniref:probable G-protein coupled receptor 158 n=1 Tax=Eupeodes corollae TaxID=290404 RepID=UPI002492A447|nr:probable G-protein coupled receptor 158 [Eupeodes corollae]
MLNSVDNNFAVFMAALFMLIIMLVIQESRTANEMLFIRHGRSRVRHSNEKDHIRWGLQAFDNLTFDYDVYENDTVSFGSGSGSNMGQLFGSDFWYNSESNGSTGIYNQSIQGLKQDLNVTEDSDTANTQMSSTIMTPTEPIVLKRKKIHKKKIMENIRKNVDKGLEYLKTHRNIPQPSENIQQVIQEALPQRNTGAATIADSSVAVLKSTNNIFLSYSVPTRYNQQQSSTVAQKETSYITTEKHHLVTYTPGGKDNDNDNVDSHVDRESLPSTSLRVADIRAGKNNEADYELNDDSSDNSQIQPHTGDMELNRSGSTNSDEKDLRHVVLQEADPRDVNFGEINIDGGAVETDDDNLGSEIDALNLDENGNNFNLDGSSKSMETNKYLEEVGDSATNEDELYDWDEISRNNRRNLMRGRDVVTKFLQIVETQHSLGSNCEAGTSLNLGEGVVDRYAQDRFRIEAEVAVNRANMLTRIFKMTSPSVQASVNLLHASVLSMVEFDDDIFAAGNCFDWNQHPSQQGLFCPFAYRLPPPNQGALFAKDLATEYHYLGNTSEWFFLARKNAKKVIARNDQYIKAFHLYSNKTEERIEEDTLSVHYEDGRWSKPYYDCGGGNIWMLTYTVPFFGYENGTYFFKGTSGIDIDLRRVDIDQCPQRNTQGVSQPLNIFAGTDKCKQRTTMCEALKGLGFRRGSYKCVCRKGFYFPDTMSMHKFFNGSILEEEYEKLMLGKNSTYNNVQEYECLPCAEGCDSCEDNSPCIAALNWPMRTSILVLACAIIGLLPPAAWFTFRYQQVKVVRAASPALLRVIAMGAFCIYCTTIVMYPNPSLYTCTARIWLREIGFSLTYGALMLKTWRISVIFRVRSAKAVKITDAALLRRLGVICAIIGICLLVRTLVSPPIVVVKRTADDLKAFLCKTDWWDYTFTSMEVLFLAWGVRLCIMVRKAPSEFNESRFISMAIYNEFLLTCFLNVSMLFLQSPANSDLLYIIFFSHTQLTVTLLLGLIFGSKVYIVLRSGKAHLEAIGMGAKSSGAKFNFRPQLRTFGNPSSATTSTAQIETKLSDQEALEEIRLLSLQLQRIQEMAPSKGVAVTTISHLLENLKLYSSNTLQSSTTKLQHQTSHISIFSLNKEVDKYQQNNNTTILPITNITQDSQALPTIQVAAKSVNTSMTGEEYLQSLLQLNTSIKCNSCKQLEKRSAITLSCQQLGSPQPEGSISFSNIKLDCMCSQPSNLDNILCENVERITLEQYLSKTNTSCCKKQGLKTRTRKPTTLGQAKTSSSVKIKKKHKFVGDNISNNINCDSYKKSEHFLICDNCRNKLSRSLKKISSSCGPSEGKSIKHRSNELLEKSVLETTPVIGDNISSSSSTIESCAASQSFSVNNIDQILKKNHSTEDVTFYTTDDETGGSTNGDLTKVTPNTLLCKKEKTRSTSSASILPALFSDTNGSQSNESYASNGAKKSTDTRVPHRPDKLLLDLNDRSKYTKEVSV